MRPESCEMNRFDGQTEASETGFIGFEFLPGLTVLLQPFGGRRKFLPVFPEIKFDVFDELVNLLRTVFVQQNVFRHVRVEAEVTPLRKQVLFKDAMTNVNVVTCVSLTLNPESL